MSVEDMAAVCHSEFPEIVNQVMSFSAFQPIGLSLQLIIELLVTARTKPLIVKVHPKTRTAAIIILSILIQFSHYSPQNHYHNRINKQSEIVGGKMWFMIDDAIDGFNADEEVQEQEGVMHLKIQSAVAVVLLKLQAVGNWYEDMQVFHREKQDESNQNSDQSKSSRVTHCDVVGYSYDLRNYFDRFDGQYHQQCFGDYDPWLCSFSSIQDSALKPQNHYLFELPAQEDDQEMRVHL